MQFTRDVIEKHWIIFLVILPLISVVSGVITISDFASPYFVNASTEVANFVEDNYLLFTEGYNVPNVEAMISQTFVVLGIDVLFTPTDTIRESIPNENENKLKAIISSDSCFKPGEINYFSGINSTFDSPILEYEWLFSDHIQPEQHTTGTVKRDFKEEGKYTATLLVRDNLKGSDVIHFPFEVSYHCLE